VSVLIGCAAATRRVPYSVFHAFSKVPQGLPAVITNTPVADGVLESSMRKVYKPNSTATSKP